MKFVLMALMLLSNIAAANAEERKTLLTGRNITSGGFAGPVVRIGQVDDNTQYMMGMRGAWLINHRYYLGIAGYHSLNRVGTTNQKLGYGGLLLGMKFQPASFVHFSTDLLTGIGGLSDYETNMSENMSHRHKHGSGWSDKLFIIEPSAALHMNLARYMELTVGASYRFVFDSDDAELSDNALSGILFNLGAIFGRF